MWFRSFLDSLRPRPSGPLTRRRSRGAGAFRPRLEALEDRCLLTLGLATHFAAGAYPLDMTVGDFNGDGKADLATVNASQLSLLYGNGDGTFRDAQTTDAGSGLTSVAAGDFNGDQRLDLAITSRVTTWNGSAYVTEALVNVLLNGGNDAGGNAAFGAARRFSTGTNTSPGAVAVGDLNGDGKLDVAAAATNGSAVTVLLGTGTGDLQAARQLAAGSSPSSVAVGDVNRDGKLDLITANRGGGSVSVLLNGGNDASGNVAFQAPRNTAIYGDVEAVAVGDFDANGKLDLAVTSSVSFWDYYSSWTEGYVNVLLGNGDGSFATPRATLANNVQLGDLAVADFNADGKLDVVTADGPQSPTIDPTVLLGRGDGSFDAPYHFDAGAGPVAVAAADLDGDDDPDVAVANFRSASVSVLLNDNDWPPLGAPLVSVSDASVVEGDDGTTTAVFTVSLSEAFGQAVSVRYSTADGSALSGSDYRSVAGVLTFNPGGPLSQTVSVLVNGDRRAESSEYFFVTLSDPVNARIGDGGGFGSITDDEPWVTIGNAQVDEGNVGPSPSVFTLTLAEAIASPVTVDWFTGDSGAAAGSDYEAAFGTVTFTPGGPLTQTITVLVTGDTVAEYDYEYFHVALSNGQYGYGVIVDDEPRVSIGDVTVVERSVETTTAVFTLRLSAASTERVTVNFSTAEGDTEAWSGYDYYGYYYPPPPAASAGDDFVSQAGSVTFEPGQTTAEVRVVVNGDRLTEDYEYFSVDLGGTSANAIVSDGHATALIIDDEPRFSVSSVSVTEGNTGTTTAVVTVSLAVAYDIPVSVSWATADGSALSGSDYRSATGVLTFSPGGPLSQTVSVLVNGDRLAEGGYYGQEHFFVRLSSPSQGIVTGDGTVYVQDDEPRLSISDVRVTEGSSGTQVLQFIVRLSAASEEPVTVNYATQNGTATTADNDYVATSGSLTFGKGETSKVITVVVNGDTKVESDEYFYVVLSGASDNALISDGWGLGYITNDDVAPRRKRK